MLLFLYHKELVFIGLQPEVDGKIESIKSFDRVRGKTAERRAKKNGWSLLGGSNFREKK